MIAAVRLFCFAFILAVSVLTPLLAEAYDVVNLSYMGPPRNRIDLVITGDGYTANQQGKLLTDATNLVDEFLAQNPYTEYAAHFNFYVVHLFSNESGADHPSQGVFRDTALDSTYDAFGIARLLVVDDAKAIQVAADAVPEVDFVLVVVNDVAYGGSGGQVMVASTHTLSGEIALHECGHAFAGLADEYTDPFPGYPQGDWEPNVTYQAERNQIPWGWWIEDTTPVPTPEASQYADVVGLFEGARYLENGIYRPVLDNCKMNILGRPFDPVCNEAHVASIYAYVSPTDIETEKYFEVEYGTEIELDPEVVQTASQTVEVSWTINGEQSLKTYGPLNFEAYGRAPGIYTVAANIKDMNPMIRIPENQAHAQATGIFRVTVNYATGDINGDMVLDIGDAILALQIMVGFSSDDVNPGSDVNGDGRIGLEEVSFIMQRISGVRE